MSSGVNRLQSRKLVKRVDYHRITRCAREISCKIRAYCTYRAEIRAYHRKWVLTCAFTRPRGRLYPRTCLPFSMLLATTTYVRFLLACMSAHRAVNVYSIIKACRSLRNDIARRVIFREIFRRSRSLRGRAAGKRCW